MKRFATIALVGVAACGGEPKAPTIRATETPTTPVSAPASEAPAAPASAAEAPAPKQPPNGGADTGKVTDQGRALLEQARAAAGNGDVGGALSALKAAAEDSPGLVEVHYNLGIVSEWMGRVSTAQKHYATALRIDPEHTATVVALARLRARAGDIAGAVAEARSHLERKPDSLRLRNAYDRVRLLQRGQASDVAKTATAVLRKDEKNADAMVNLAMANIDMGRQELALAILENVKPLQPQNPEVLVLQAIAHDRLGEDRRARAALEQAISLPGGGSAEAHNNLGLLYHEAGDFTGAEEQFRKALLRWPDMLSAHVNLANALKGQQRFGEAQQTLKRALAIAPNSPEVAYNTGILYLDGQLPELEAINRLEQAIGFFEKYKQLAGDGRKADDPVDSYIDEAKKRIEVEQKRAEQMRRAAKTPAPPGGGGAAAAGAAEPSEAGDDAADDEGEQ
ncbi:MAG: tetratricopeptide repeat protein [Myxococcales bacterium]|nr:tetratricopeptide repeat protein [Myxococcales bacterium]MCB9524995.1 tetratricopeptide repeat protein [Myxococcales bacterium]